nr:RNA-directed DNA polymerase, eukaryota [Tanacetum cinerariifolium]
MGSLLINGSPTLEFEFHKGSKQGLKINLHKSKFMRIGVSSNVVAAATSLIGCSILTAPFNYLGVKAAPFPFKVGSHLDSALSYVYIQGALDIHKLIPRRSPWQDVIFAIHSLQSKDIWCWSLEGSQEFSVKSSRILIDNTILPKAEVPTRWLRVVPIKRNGYFINCLSLL